MVIYTGPFKVFTHGDIRETYINAPNLGFVSFGHLIYTDVVVPDHISINPYAHLNNNEIFTKATIEFPTGEQVQKVGIYIKMNVPSVGKPDFKIIPNVIALWNRLCNDTNYTNLVYRLNSDAAINRSMYSRITSDNMFCNMLVSIGVDKDMSVNHLFNDTVARSFYLWKHSIGFCHNELEAKFDVAGRKAAEELIQEYIESEKVYRTDPLRDKIDDALHLMNVNGDKLKRQLWYFNNRI